MSHKLLNYNSTWKKLLGFKNMQEKLENIFSKIIITKIEKTPSKFFIN